MTIGDKILDLIIRDGLVRAEFINGNTLFIWQGNAAEQLEALVEAQYQKRPLIKDVMWQDQSKLKELFLPEGITRIYLMSQRKGWYHELPEGWKEVAHERFDYVECGIFDKPTKDLTGKDFNLSVDYAKRPDGWIEPTIL